MKRILDIAFVCVIFVCALCISCDKGDIESVAPSNAVKTARMELDVYKQGFDKDNTQRTRSAESSWNDNDNILLRFHTDNGIVTGKAVYNSAYGDWEVSYTGVLNREKESRVEVSFFDNAPCDDGITVMLSSKYGAYQDKEGTYMYSDGTIKISALLKPLTSRIMFKGEKYENIEIIGLRSLVSYDLNNDVLVDTDEIISTSIKEGNNTGYLYVKKDENSNKFSILRLEDYDYLFSSIYTPQMLNVGKSGWMNIPTTTKHNGWTMKQVSGEDENGHMWIDLGLPSGTKWADENIGASMADYQDNGNISYLRGDSFSWGADKGQTSYCTWTTDIQGNASYDTALRTLSGNWVLPSKADFEELIKECKWTWTDWYGDGKSTGFEVKGPNGECIFIPCLNIQELYWSSTPQSTSKAWCLYLTSRKTYSMESWIKGGYLNIRAVIK